MACPNEFAWSMYVDGELDPKESQRLGSHLNECGPCHSLAVALNEEGRLLTHLLQEMDLEVEAENRVAASVSAPMSILNFGISILVPAAIFRSALDWLSGNPMPPFLAWLDPLSLSGQLNLMATGIVYALNEGVSTVAFLARNIMSAAIAILLLSVLVRLRCKLLASSTVLMLFVLALFVSPAHAVDVRRGEPNVTVAAGETVDDSLVFFGESITIDGTVTGDLIAFGRQITVRGAVQGSVFSFAQRVEVTGSIGGNVLGFAQSVRIDGGTTGNLYAGAQSVTVGDDGDVAGNGVVGAQDVVVNGVVGRDLIVGANSLTIAGALGRNLLFGGETLTVQAPAQIGGNLEAHIVDEENLSVDPGASILGTTTLEIPSAEPSRFRTIAFYLSRLIRLLAAFIAGLFLFWIYPPARDVRFDDGRALLTAGGIGFLLAVATPIAAILAGITLIGLPVALTSVAAWLLGLYLGKVVVAQFVGRAMLASSSIKTSSTVGPFLAGLVLVFIAVNLPYIGGVVNALLTLTGFGALIVTAYRSWREPGESFS